MRTFKWIGLFLSIAFGLILTGCDSYKAYYAGPNGLEITVQGANIFNSHVTVKAQDFTFTVDPSHLTWYYDVTEGDDEYVIVEYAPLGQKNSDIKELQLHLLTSKKPADFGK